MKMNRAINKIKKKTPPAIMPAMPNPFKLWRSGLLLTKIIETIEIAMPAIAAIRPPR